MVGPGYSPEAGLPTSPCIVCPQVLGGTVHTVVIVNLNMYYGPFLKMVISLINLLRKSCLKASGLHRNKNHGLATACFKVESNTPATD